MARLSPSTARRFRKHSSKPSSSATRKGAFTGASTRKLGKFEIAHRGTLFLDEIGDLPLLLQAKILRALEEKRFERVGGTGSIQVDVRVVAATNRNLKAAVAARQYREDLYFRLSVFPITIPPLRDRADDIPMLAKYFVERFSRDLNKKPLVLAASAVDEMRAYPWPGVTCASSRTASSARSS
jgi:transcriptional regulator with GAF, ATPase, and Fis domain